MNSFELKNRKALLLLASREISAEWSLSASEAKGICESIGKLKPSGLHFIEESSDLYNGILLMAGRKRIYVKGKTIIVYETSVYNVFYERNNNIEKALFYTAPKGIFPDYVKMKIGISRRRQNKFNTCEDFIENYINL